MDQTFGYFLAAQRNSGDRAKGCKPCLSAEWRARLLAASCHARGVCQIGTRFLTGRPRPGRLKDYLGRRQSMLLFRATG